MRKHLLYVALIGLLLLGGCGKTVDSYTEFSIQEFDDFFAIVDDVQRELYIREGNLESASVNDMVICPFIKEITHEQCALFIYVYSLDCDNKQVVINSASLTTKDGIILCDEDTKKITELTFITEKMASDVVEVCSFEKNEEWFFSGNKLELSFQISVSDEKSSFVKDLKYEVKMIGHKTFLAPT